MKRASIILYITAMALIILPNFALAGSATVSWSANSEDDLAGYRIYYGTTQGGPYGSSSALIDKTKTSYTISNLSDGTYYFVVVALDTSDNESAYSREVSKTIASTSASTTDPTSGTTTTASPSSSGTTTAAPTSSTTTSTTSSDATAGSVSSPIKITDASGIYGQVSGVSDQLNQISFSFDGRPGKARIYYKGYDIDSRTEVKILLNGKTVGYVKQTKNNKWSETRRITLKANYLNNSTINVLTFQSTSISPSTNPWGIQIIDIK